AVLAFLPLSVVAATPPSDVLLTLFLFFAKASAFVFGSGLAIVPFLYGTVVQQEHWLTEHQFLDAVAVAIITPGPVVITVAFIGYLVAGITGATVAALGMFLPTYLLTVVPLPWFRRYRDQPQLRAFVAGASLGVLWRWRLPEPVLILVVGLIGVGIWLVLGRAA